MRFMDPGSSPGSVRSKLCTVSFQDTAACGGAVLQLCVNLIVCGDGIEHTGMAGMGLSGLVGMGERR